MAENIKHKQTIPVLSTSDLKRDISWYAEYAGFGLMFEHQGYAGLYRDGMALHLQWHNNTPQDPVHGGVVKFFIDNIEPVVQEFVERGTIKVSAFKKNTPWGTHEFGFYDLNQNAIYFVQDI